MNLGNATVNRLFAPNSEKQYISGMDKVNPDDPNSSLTYIVNAIPENSIVLDVGCSNGYLGQWLIKNKNCTLYGIDIDLESVNYVKKDTSYKGAFLLDLDFPEKMHEDYNRFINLECSFDYIICADVLEHLKDPSLAIEFISRKLKINGEIVVSIPDVSNLDIIINLLRGKFNYSEFGILDNSHLRFFTKESFAEWIESLNKRQKNLNFDLQFLGSTIYISEFIKNIRDNNSLMFNLLSLQGLEHNSLQNIFVLKKIELSTEPKNLTNLLLEQKKDENLIIEQIEKYLEQKNKEIEIQQNLIEGKDKEIKEKEKTIQEKEKTIQEKENYNQLLQKDLNALKGSTSWRITAPLRNLSDAIKGNKRRKNDE